VTEPLWTVHTDDVRAVDPDLYYLAETLTELQAAVRLCQVTVLDTTDPDPHTLARRTRAAQERLTRATRRCRRAWGLDDPPSATEAPRAPA